MMLPVFLIVVPLPLILLSLFFQLNLVNKPVRPPGPPTIPLIGNLHQLSHAMLHRRLGQLSKLYGPVMSLRLGTIPAIVISSARVAKEAFKNYDAELSGRLHFKATDKLSYGGKDIAFNDSCDLYWRFVRKISVLHVLNPKKIQASVSIREDEVSKMIKDIHERAVSSETVSLSKKALALGGTVISRTAFGKDYTSREFTNVDFFGLLGKAQAALAAFMVGNYFPVVGDWIDRLAGTSGRLQVVYDELDSFYEMIIEDHVRTRNKNGGYPDEEKQDLIDYFLRLSEDVTSSSIELTNDHIKALIMEETRTRFGHKSFISEEDLPSLPYLEAVIKETLRLHPPTPLLVPRRVTDHCTISNYPVEPGTLVYFNGWAIGRDSEYWESGELSYSVDEFWPERFLGDKKDVNFKGQDFGLIPFGSGRRICPGLNFAAHLLQLALANLVHSFAWELPAGMKTGDLDTKEAPGITVHKKVELCLVPKII